MSYGQLQSQQTSHGEVQSALHQAGVKPAEGSQYTDAFGASHQAFPRNSYAPARYPHVMPVTEDVRGLSAGHVGAPGHDGYGLTGGEAPHMPVPESHPNDVSDFDGGSSGTQHIQSQAQGSRGSRGSGGARVEKGPSKTLHAKETGMEMKSHMKKHVTIEKVVEVPQTHVRQITKQISVPDVIERIIQKPVEIIKEVEVYRPGTTRTMERIIEVPAPPHIETRIIQQSVKIIQERLIEVPKPFFKEKIEYVDTVEYREVPIDKIIEIPEIEYRIREVPYYIPQEYVQEYFVDKYVEFPEVQIQEVHREENIPIFGFKKDDVIGLPYPVSSDTNTFAEQPSAMKFHSPADDNVPSPPVPPPTAPLPMLQLAPEVAVAENKCKDCSGTGKVGRVWTSQCKICNGTGKPLFSSKSLPAKGEDAVQAAYANYTPPPATDIFATQVQPSHVRSPTPPTPPTKSRNICGHVQKKKATSRPLTISAPPQTSATPPTPPYPGIFGMPVTGSLPTHLANTAVTPHTYGANGVAVH